MHMDECGSFYRDTKEPPALNKMYLSITCLDNSTGSCHNNSSIINYLCPSHRFTPKLWSEVQLSTSAHTAEPREMLRYVWANNWSTARGSVHTSNTPYSLLNISLFCSCASLSFIFQPPPHQLPSPPSVRHNVTRLFLIKLSECKITHQIGFMSNMPKSLHTHTSVHYLSEHLSPAQSVYTCESWP